MNGKKVDVYRVSTKAPNQRSVDVWLDSTTGQLAGVSIPGADQFDPVTDEDGNDVPARSRGRRGTIRDIIVFNPPLSDDLFDMTLPDGYELVDTDQ